MTCECRPELTVVLFAESGRYAFVACHTSENCAKRQIFIFCLATPAPIRSALVVRNWTVGK